MKKTILCNIPMKDVQQTRYISDDLSLPASDREVRYPICAYLERTLSSEDELKVILLIKKDPYGNYEHNVSLFQDELESVVINIGVPVQYVLIDTEFEETRSVHEQLMGRLVDEIEDGSHILADITYGPKDLPIVVFSALNFAEKFLDCSVDNIIYGKAIYANNKVVDAQICDMIPLFYLGSVTNMIRSTNSDKARTMLKSLLSM